MLGTARGITRRRRTASASISSCRPGSLSTSWRRRPGLPRDVGRRAGQRKRLSRAKHVRLAGSDVPQSLSRPHSPILIAGSGERRTTSRWWPLRRRLHIRPSRRFPRQLDLLRRLCEDEGRGFSTQSKKTAPYAFDVGEDGSKANECCGTAAVAGRDGDRDRVGWVVGVTRSSQSKIMGRDRDPAVAAFPAPS